MSKEFFIFCAILIYIGSSCSQTGKKNEEKKSTPDHTITIPHFNADSSYSYVHKQVGFGPRVAGTKSHKQCQEFLINKLTQFGAKIYPQSFEAQTYDGQLRSFTNIIGSFNAHLSHRILLAAHWDTRPFADKDSLQKNAPFDGANDGASGVGVLLEVARNISLQLPSIGIDIIFFDGEDWGEPADSQSQKKTKAESWCLGSQHWSKNKHIHNYAAYYGILLDMVGAKDSQFHKEGTSMTYAPRIVEKVWKQAHELGYANYFIHENQAPILDDHFFLNTLGHIPTIDIVHYEPGVGYFGYYHHTRKDNLTLISKNTLLAVGETLLHVIYSEK